MPFPLSREEHDAIESRIQDQIELIITAAIKIGDVIITTERPERHGTCINFLFKQGLEYKENQGFMTNKGRFVDRKEAAKIAIASGQGSPRELCGGLLFSEDLWMEL